MDAIYLNNYPEFALKAKLYASKLDPCVILDSCGISPQLNKGNYKLVIGFGGTNIITPSSNKIDSLYNEWHQNKRWMFGVIGYDVKNEIENLSSLNNKCFNWPELLFFIPEVIITVNWKDQLSIVGRNASELFNEISSIKVERSKSNSYPTLARLIQDLWPDEHKEKVNAIKEEITNGNVYEMNLCSRFLYNDMVVEDPYKLYSDLIQISPSPFSAYFKANNYHVGSASPERYLTKKNNALTSQPIKGTRPRSKDIHTDELLKSQLYSDKKDRAENVMIVDLVRNDLGRVSVPGSVVVEELFGIYTYSHVHQMVSTISSQLDPQYSWRDVLKATFPMGSMTGAPKIAAMQWIEKFELSAREWYSGALGYIDPDGNMDFSVLIRSIFYDSDSRKLAYFAGGAITIDSDPAEEYEEMMVKAKAINSLLDG